jgi:hypothetical protein
VASKFITRLLEVGKRNSTAELLEVGKRNSTADMKRLQSAHDALVEAGVVCTKTNMGEALRVDDSYQGRMEMIRRAVRVLFMDPDRPYEYSGCYIRDCFATDVVVQVGDEIYQIPYSIDGEQCTLGAPIEVDVAYIPAGEMQSAGDIVERNLLQAVRKKLSKPATVTEAATDELAFDFVELKENAVGADGSAIMKLIQPGWGASGYYPPEVLKRDGPKVFTRGLKMFWNHQTKVEEAQRPEGSLYELAGELTSDARWMDHGPAGSALYADAKVFSAYQATVNELAPSIGVSIRAEGRARDGEAEGKKGPIIERIAVAKSVDFVTSPGAGGEIVELFEAARSRNKKALEKPTVENNKELTERLANQDKQIAELLRAETAREAQTFVAAQLTEKAKALPAVSHTRLSAELSKNPPVKDGRIDVEAYGKRIDEAVSAEARYIAQISGAGEVRGMGSASTVEDEKAISESTKKLETVFRELGLSESGAAIAAKGRK